MIAHFHIDPISSNYPREIFNPKGYRKADYFENIVHRYTAAAAAPQHPVSASVGPAIGPPTGPPTAPLSVALQQAVHAASDAAAQLQRMKRKSKWDDPTNTASGSAPAATGFNPSEVGARMAALFGESQR